MKSISIIDSHVHFWDPAKLKYDWLESAGALNHPFLLTDYHKATEGIEVDKMVFVECNCHPGSNEEEVIWVQELAKSDERIQAIVAYADLTEVNTIDLKLKKLAAHKMVKGIRHNIQFNEPGFAIQPIFIEGVKKVLDLDLHFELCITHDQLAECIELVSALPERPLAGGQVRGIEDPAGESGVEVHGELYPSVGQPGGCAQRERIETDLIHPAPVLANVEQVASILRVSPPKNIRPRVGDGNVHQLPVHFATDRSLLLSVDGEGEIIKVLLR